jgi:hypothetical protein
LADAIDQPQDKTQHQSGDHQKGGKTHQFARHQQQTLLLRNRLRRHHGQIDKNARQIKQAGEPASYKNNMKRFNPEHFGSLAVALIKKN